MEDPVKLTDTQLVLLSAASQRDDRALERPSNLVGGAAGKVVAKLLAEGLIEEIQSRGSLPVWRRDEEGPRTLRITKKGLQAIRVEDEPDVVAAHGAAKKPPASSAKQRKSAKAAPDTSTPKRALDDLGLPPRPGRPGVIRRAAPTAAPAIGPYEP
jgi:hypothetical protein